jgi:hypothetical protein
MPYLVFRDDCCVGKARAVARQITLRSRSRNQAKARPRSPGPTPAPPTWPARSNTAPSSRPAWSPHPDLVAVLHRHLDRFGTGADGLPFVTRTAPGGRPLAPPYCHPVSMNTIYRIWHLAKTRALTDDAATSPLARRPYDLRHACLSTWLAGFPVARVAAWAGNGIGVLLAVYAHCIHGQDHANLRRIETVLPPTDTA